MWAKTNMEQQEVNEIIEEIAEIMGKHSCELRIESVLKFVKLDEEPKTKGKRVREKADKE